MKKLQYPLINSLVLILTLFINYWSNTGAINGQTIGDVSQQYESLLTPAGYAFAIWGVIYLSLIALVVYQWVASAKQRTEPLVVIGYSLAIANVLNTLWVVVWLHEYLWLSLVIMISLLVVLTSLTIRLSRWITGSSRGFWFVKFPIFLYQGWIIVALVANSSAVFSANLNLPFSDTFWSFTVLTVAFAIYLYESLKLRQFISALVGVWGVTAIGFKQFHAVDTVAFAAFATSILLFLVTVSSLVRKKVSI